MSDRTTNTEHLGLDPIDALLFSGEAATAHEAEELYLDRSLPRFLELVASSLSNGELSRHPLTKLLVSHGSRSREDWL